jgi:hypothetical protein
MEHGHRKVLWCIKESLGMYFVDLATAYFSGGSEPAIAAAGEEAELEMTGKPTVRSILCW